LDICSVFLREVRAGKDHKDLGFEAGITDEGERQTSLTGEFSEAELDCPSLLRGPRYQ
jgi:hypothetical protein